MQRLAAARALLRLGANLETARDFRNADFVTNLSALVLRAEENELSEERFASLYERQRRIEENGGMFSVADESQGTAEEIYPGVPRNRKKLQQKALSDPDIPTDEYGNPLEGLKLKDGGFLSLKQLREEMERASRQGTGAYA